MGNGMGNETSQVHGSSADESCACNWHALPSLLAFSAPSRAHASLCSTFASLEG
jgi:hypothetical protein